MKKCLNSLLVITLSVAIVISFSFFSLPNMVYADSEYDLGSEYLDFAKYEDYVYTYKLDDPSDDSKEDNFRHGKKYADALGNTINNCLNRYDHSLYMFFYDLDDADPESGYHLHDNDDLVIDHDDGVHNDENLYTDIIYPHWERNVKGSYTITLDDETKAQLDKEGKYYFSSITFFFFDESKYSSTGHVFRGIEDEEKNCWLVCDICGAKFEAAGAEAEKAILDSKCKRHITVITNYEDAGRAERVDADGNFLNDLEPFVGEYVHFNFYRNTGYKRTDVKVYKDNESKEEVADFELNQWDNDGPDSSFSMPACDVIMEITYEKLPPLKVNFMVDDEVYLTKEVNDGEKVSKPEDPKKDGYVFDGWYYIFTDRDETLEADYDFDTTVTYEDLTLYARWKKSEDPGQDDSGKEDPGKDDPGSEDEGKTPSEPADDKTTPTEPTDDKTTPTEPTGDTPAPVTPAKKPISISKAKVSIKASYAYTGKKKTPALTVKVNGKTLKKGTDYTVKHSTRKSVGTATITIKGKGDYTGTKKVTFKIIPKKTTLSSLKPAKKAITVKWKKMSTKMTKKRITGYQIQYSLKKNFSSKKSIKVKGYKRTSYKIKNLKSKKRYYVRVRTYMKVGDKTYYSKWSNVKNIKTK